MGGTFTTADLNQATFQRTGGNVNLTGTLDNTADTLNIGKVQLSGGRINNGTVDSDLAFTSSSLNRLDNVMVNGDLDFSPSTSSRVRLQNGLTLNGTATLNSSNDAMSFGDGTQTLDGTADVVLTGNASLAVEPFSTLIIDNGVTVRGSSGRIGDDLFTSGNFRTLINDGLISSDQPGTISVLPNTFTNNGTVEATLGGTLSISTNDFTNNDLLVAGPNGTVNVTGSVANLSGSTLTGGTWNVLADGGPATLNLGGEAITTNAADVTLSGANSVFTEINSLADNQGSFSIEGGRTFTFGGPLTNSGTLTADGTGSVVTLPSGGTNTGTMQATNGGLLNFAAGTMTGGTLSTTSGGTISVLAPASVQNAAITNQGLLDVFGTLDTSTLDNDSELNVTGGAMTVAGALTNSGTAQLFGSVSASSIDNSGTMELDATANVTAANGLVNSASLLIGGGTVQTNTLTNELIGVLDAHGTIDGSLENRGTMDLTGNLTINDTVNNIGTVNVGASEQLNVASLMTNSGLVELSGGNIAGAGQLTNLLGGQIRGGSAVSVSLTNDGGLIHANGASALLLGNLDGGNINGGELRVEDGSTMSVLQPFSSSGTIAMKGSSSLLSGGDITNNGTISGVGRITNRIDNNNLVRATGGRLTMAASGGTNSASGLIEVSIGAEVFYTQGLATNAGIITLLGGAHDNNGNPTFNSGLIFGYGTFRSGGLMNDGTIDVGGGDMNVFGNVVNDGTVDVQVNNSIRFFDDASGSGDFIGTGTVEFLGNVSPGSSTAAVSFGGDVSLSGNTTLIMEISGLVPGQDYDQLNVFGALTVAGDLDIVLTGGFAPNPLDTFDLLNYSGFIGDFGNINLPSLPGNLFWDASQLSVTGEVTTLPEPSTSVFVVVGVLGLLVRRAPRTCRRGRHSWFRRI